MKKIKLLSSIAAVLLGSACFMVPTTGVQAEESSDFACDFIVSSTSDSATTNYTHYGCQELITYTEEEATAAGIPAGFSGDVLSVVSNVINRGVTLDFSEKKIPINLVKSLTFRVYIGGDGKVDGYPELRIPRPYLSGAWDMRYYLGDATDQWVDVVLQEGDGSFFDSAACFNNLAENGYLNKFELAMRHNGNVGVFYIDSIAVNLVDNDGVAPVISYVGEDTVYLSKGQALPFTVSATDSVEGEVAVEYVWGDPTLLDSNGEPMEGTHSLTFKAVDYFGNVATKTVTVIVEEPDLTPPTMVVPASIIYAKTGAIPRISVAATDDKDEQVAMEYVWSQGALNARGRLTEGTHTLTITATDLSGNKTVETITFVVTATGDYADVIIDEEALCPDVEEDSSDSSVDSSVEESEDSSVEEPEDSSIDSSVEEPEDSSVEESVEVSEEESEEESEEASEEDSAVKSEDEESEEDEESLGDVVDEPSIGNGCFGSIGGVSCLSGIVLAAGVLLKKKNDE